MSGVIGVVLSCFNTRFATKPTLKGPVPKRLRMNIHMQLKLTPVIPGIESGTVQTKLYTTSTQGQ